jgi:hypothetical protein
MKEELRRLDRGVPQYYYRRDLTAAELLPAVGAAVGAALAIFYVARVLIQRTPLTADATPASPRRPAGRRRARGA